MTRYSHFHFSQQNLIFLSSFSLQTIKGFFCKKKYSDFVTSHFVFQKVLGLQLSGRFSVQMCNTVPLNL